MTTSSHPIGRTGEPADRLGREPARAAAANGTPRRKPTHQVATMPHPIPRSVGSSVPKIGGWQTVKYSTHTRAVTWSWAMPYRTDAAMHIRTMPSDCTSDAPPLHALDGVRFAILHLLLMGLLERLPFQVPEYGAEYRPQDGRPVEDL